MSDVVARKASKTFRRQRSIYQVHYALPRHDEEMYKPLPMPADAGDVQAYGLQVAGHMDSRGRKYLGVLQCNNGTILKPVLKEAQWREVEFYARLSAAVSSSAPQDLAELRKFAPRYYGCRKFSYNGYEQDYIVLEDLAERMLEPCIMDVKIGKRTWDPLATEEKIRNEQAKYAQCKQEFGFCIPGYQVHRLADGRLHKYGKDHGKKLHGGMVRAALRNFLNGSGVEAQLCRALVLQFLSELWKIQKWAGRQRGVRLYATSLLLAYDAVRLRGCCGDSHEEGPSMKKCRPPVTRRKSIHSMSPEAGSNFSGQISSKGPVYRKVNSVPLTSMSLAQASFSQDSRHSPWSEAWKQLNHNHSFDHNYEDKLSKIKMNYRALLDQLSTDSLAPNPWGTVKIIDFAHAFFNEDDDGSIDENFKEGIDNFVQIFEDFLSETDDQVF